MPDKCRVVVFERRLYLEDFETIGQICLKEGYAREEMLLSHLIRSFMCMNVNGGTL